MADSGKTYRVTEVVGTSTESIHQAVRNGVARASRTLHGLEWFEVLETRGSISDGQVDEFQVTMKIGFRLDA
jgi:flavin-binding protein dodecin